MTDSEMLFKSLVIKLAMNGVYPSPGNINRIYNPKRGDRHMLNGRENRWRGEVLRLIGWTYLTGPVWRRWVPPTGHIPADGPLGVNAR